MDPFPIALSPSSTAPAVLGAAPKRARRTTEEKDSLSPNLADFSFSYASISSEMVFVAMHGNMHEDSLLSIVAVFYLWIDFLILAIGQDSDDSSVHVLICESGEWSELRPSSDDSDCDDFYEMIFFVP